MAVKPSAKPDWTSATPAARTEPTSGKKNTGWTIDERPAFQYMNWLFFNIDEWIDYFEEVTDGFIGFQAIYDAFVGTGGLATHATINDAMVDVSAGARILVLNSATINTIQQITKNNVIVEFQGNVVYTKGTATTAIQVSADEVKIVGGKFSGFSTSGDKAIIIDSGSDYTQIRDSRFLNCDTDISDLASTSSISGTIST